MSLILAAHGTRRPSGVAMIGDLAARVSELLDGTVHVAFVDVLGPTPTEVLSSLSGLSGPATERSRKGASTRPAIVVPAFLSRGYHVRVDLPAHIAASGHPNVTVTPALGPSWEIARILREQLAESGCKREDSVILAAAGTSDPRALADLRSAATSLSMLTGARVELGFAATGSPDVRTAVDSARQRGASRVVVASYLLADGLFQDRLHDSGADLITRPIGTHPGLARLIANRFRNAMPHRFDRRRMQHAPNFRGRKAVLFRHAESGGA